MNDAPTLYSCGKNSPLLDRAMAPQCGDVYRNAVGKRVVVDAVGELTVFWHFVKHGSDDMEIRHQTPKLEFIRLALNSINQGCTFIPAK